MTNGNTIFAAILAGLIGFVVTYVLLLIVVAILEAVGVAEAAAVVRKFAWLISLLVGIVTGYGRYSGNRQI